MTTRIISATVGLFLLFAVVFLRHTLVFPIVLGLLVCIILYELAKAVDALEHRLSLAGSFLCGFLTILCTFWSQAYDNSGIVTPMSVAIPYAVLNAAEQLLMPLFLLLTFIDFVWHHKNFKIEQLGCIIASTFLVPWSLAHLIPLGLSEHGILYMIMALGGAWIADSGAYFSGIALGKHKLCPNISPKKTIEGFVGGLVCNAVVFSLVFLICAYIQGLPFGLLNGCKGACLGLCCAGVSVLGDLAASVIKREKNIKDYGNIMPGHGGMMDRFDSALFVIPMFYLFVTTFPII
ncbi:MAG: phosphatidate cytidylyltransferase [Oscillospiraceae bacterium]|nr:phosphatidate cytidylyltransferase [Oscillospiraceae bacterium]